MKSLTSVDICLCSAILFGSLGAFCGSDAWAAPAPTQPKPAAPSAPAWQDVTPILQKTLQKPPMVPANRTSPGQKTVPRVPARPSLQVNRPPAGSGMLGQMPLGSKLIRGLIGFYLQRMKTTRVDGLRLTQSQKQRARALSSMIITPCCFTQPASVHGNNVAEAVKSSLRWLVAKNHTDKQITDAFVKAYGPHVLSIPPGYHLTLLPIGGAALILLLVFVLIRRWSNREDEEDTKDDMEPSARPESSEAIHS